MNSTQNDPHFPEQKGPGKIHGQSSESDKKEKYLRESGKIEDYPEDDDLNKRVSTEKSGAIEESMPLTDVSGEEKKEEYINTDERKNDMNRKTR